MHFLKRLQFPMQGCLNIALPIEYNYMQADCFLPALSFWNEHSKQQFQSLVESNIKKYTCFQ